MNLKLVLSPMSPPVSLPVSSPASPAVSSVWHWRWCRRQWCCRDTEICLVAIVVFSVITIYLCCQNMTTVFQPPVNLWQPPWQSFWILSALSSFLLHQTAPSQPLWTLSVPFQLFCDHCKTSASPPWLLSAPSHSLCACCQSPFSPSIFSVRSLSLFHWSLLVNYKPLRDLCQTLARPLLTSAHLCSPLSPETAHVLSANRNKRCM